MGILKLKVYGVDHKLLWTVFFILQALLFSCIIGTLGTQQWVETKTTYSFEGSLVAVTDSEIYCIKESSYTDLKDDICDDNSECTDTNNVLCDFITDLNSGAAVYILFEVISLICIVVWAIILVCFIFSVNCFWLSFCCSSSACLLHYIAFLSWVGLTSARFNGKCKNSDQSENEIVICASDGPNLSLFLMIIFPIILIAFIIVGRGAIYARRLEAIGIPAVETTQIVHISSPIQAQQGFTPYNPQVAYPAGQPIYPQPYQYPPPGPQSYSAYPNGPPAIGQPQYYNSQPQGYSYPITKQ
ncbi:unnamed protein product [Blepharisma stoltei]|uniref:Uncharacterized protein n=1 Tax=Blepharisma stoltei TaxID=1481888 RepID=A0AAU9JB23_9CILI|nr:unnamed protein product [Blepharisma stoltei]